LCEIPPTEQDAFELLDNNNLNYVQNLQIELSLNKKNIYFAIKPVYKLQIDPKVPCDFSLLPLELIIHIKILEAKLQGFPDWYQHCVESNIHQAFDFIYNQKKTELVTYPALEAPPMLTLSYDSKKRKTSNHSKEANLKKAVSEDTSNNQNIDPNIDLSSLSSGMLNLSLN
jgi:hypothetical protein